MQVLSYMMWTTKMWNKIIYYVLFLENVCFVYCCVGEKFKNSILVWFLRILNHTYTRNQTGLLLFLDFSQWTKKLFRAKNINGPFIPIHLSILIYICKGDTMGFIFIQVIIFNSLKIILNCRINIINMVLCICV